MAITKPTNNLIRLNDVRLSYPSLFQPKVWPNALTEPKYEATFILDKTIHVKEIDLINTRIDEILAEHKITRAKLKADHLCLKDGDLTDKPEYKGAFTIKAKSGRRFPIVNRDAKTPVTLEDNIFYGGCYVSAYIDLWNYTKPAMGVSANLKSIQFRKEGPSFDSSMHDITGAYEPLEHSDEDDLF